MNTRNGCKLTHDGHVDGNAKMPMASKLSAMKSPRSEAMLGAWCTTARPGRPQQTIHTLIRTLKKLGFEEEKGQLREWMTVARDRSAWGRKVEYKL
jgi:hypothetical protein